MLSSENSGYVYLVWASGSDLYRIGRSTDPQRYLARLQLLSAAPLVLLTSFPALDSKQETAKLYQKWRASHQCGKWFKVHPLRLPLLLADFGFSDLPSVETSPELLEKVQFLRQDLINEIQALRAELRMLRSQTPIPRATARTTPTPAQTEPPSQSHQPHQSHQPPHQPQ